MNNNRFQEQGFSILKAFLTLEEVRAIRSMLEDPDGIRKWAYTGTTKMVSFQHPGDDVLGRLARSRRIHEVAEEALGGPVRLHHVQAVFKESHSPYQFAWHQDYGYHYHTPILLPTMCTLVIAIDPCKPENGGLEIISRSHLLGRLDHRPRDASTRQLTADPERVEDYILKDPRFANLPFSLEAGDAVTFHCLTLHRSLPNRSDVRRYALNITYNREDNLTAGSPTSRGYETVEDDEEIVKGGTVFRPGEWGGGVPQIPLEVHEQLEAFLQQQSSSSSSVGGKGPEEEEQKRLIFLDPDKVMKEAIKYKCKAIKLVYKEEKAGEGGGGAIKQIIVEARPRPPI